MSNLNAPVHDSPPWNRPTKIIVAVASILFILAVLWRFQTLISPLIIAAILAYLMHPIIAFLEHRTKLSYSSAVVTVFLTLAVAVIAIFAILGIAIYNQVADLVVRTPEIIESIPDYIEQAMATLTEPISIGSFTFSLPISQDQSFDWQAVFTQIRSYIEPVLRSAGTSLGQVAVSIATGLGWMVVILFVAIYIANDAPYLGQLIGDTAAFPGYREDAERLWRAFGRIWDAYLRGQAILALVIGVTVSTVLGILGVENALALGLLSGLLEFIPFIGPLIGSGAAILVALFQVSNYLGLTSIQFAFVVFIAMMIIQQIENNVLVPRIVGDALDLNPLLVFVGALMGTSVGGILGAILAAPVLATIKLIGAYAWHKMFDEPPFPDPEPDDSDQPSWAESAWERWQLRRAGVAEAPDSAMTTEEEKK